MEPLDPSSTYLHLGTDAAVTAIPVTDDFWPTIDRRPELHTGRLVTGGPVESPWDHWEMHPEGDEVVVVTSGAITIHYDDGTRQGSTTVAAPDYVVMPAGMWHTVDPLPADEPPRLLVVTWGAGTDHRSR